MQGVAYKRRPRQIAAAVAMSVILATPVVAGTLSIDIDAGAGISLKPAWEGASKSEIGAYPIFRLHALNLFNLLDIGGPESGLSIAPSVGYISARKASSDVVLHGVGDVDQAFEAGARVSYRWQNARALFELRHGFGGYEGWVGMVGADAIFQPGTNLTIEVGPRLGFADDGFMQTYFGITAAQSAGSGYQIHEAQSGLKNVGAEAEARYQLSTRWALVGKIEYQRLIADAADSPLVLAGSRDQFTIGLGLSTRLQWSSER